MDRVLATYRCNHTEPDDGIWGCRYKSYSPQGGNVLALPGGVFIFFVKGEAAVSSGAK